jgi:hypothetical protein
MLRALTGANMAAGKSTPELGQSSPLVARAAGVRFRSLLACSAALSHGPSEFPYSADLGRRSRPPIEISRQLTNDGRSSDGTDRISIRQLQRRPHHQRTSVRRERHPRRTVGAIRHRLVCCQLIQRRRDASRYRHDDGVTGMRSPTMTWVRAGRNYHTSEHGAACHQS